jgi:cathepsin L
MNSKAILVAGLAAVASATMAPPTQVEYDLFNLWAKQYGVTFADEAEEAHRLSIFTSNHRTIVEHNAGEESFTLGHNQFSHLTPEEWSETFFGYKRPARGPMTKMNLSGHITVADSFDWTEKGAVTAVKDQGSCGSCWSFSTTGALEGANFLKTGTLTPLSEQNIMDCDTNGDQSCSGGLMDNAFQWLESVDGICSEADYPYEGKDNSCRSSKCTVVPDTSPSSYVDVEATEDALMAALNLQPVSVAVDANIWWQLYSGGVMTKNCGTSLDHGVLAVGYGTDGSNDYWKIKNSWASSWGESGYIRLKRGSDSCGVLTAASYPVL